jgi:hypothetical protein
VRDCQSPPAATAPGFAVAPEVEDHGERRARAGRASRPRIPASR